MHILNERDLPDVETLAQIIEPKDERLARTLREADDAVITFLGSGETRESTGWKTEQAAATIAVTATWTWHTRTQGARPQGATVIQVEMGGRSVGEGWATVEQHLVSRVMFAEEAAMIAHLAATGGLPRFLGSKEL